MGSRSLRPHGRLRPVVFALVGTVLPVAIAAATDSLSELLRRSDLALYAAKDSGGGRTSVAPPQLAPLPALTGDDDDDLDLDQRTRAG